MWQYTCWQQQLQPTSCAQLVGQDLVLIITSCAAAAEGHARQAVKLLAHLNGSSAVDCSLDHCSRCRSDRLQLRIAQQQGQQQQQ